MYQRSPAECAASETSLHNIHDGHHVQAPPNEQVNRLAQHQVIDSVGAQVPSLFYASQSNLNNVFLHTRMHNLLSTACRNRSLRPKKHRNYV